MEQYNFSLLAKYNKAANEKMNNIVKTISEEEWNKPFKGYFKSIHELCSHIFIADYNWLNRFKKLRKFDSLDENYFNKKYSFQETLFLTIDEYISKRTELDTIIISFIKEITVEDINKILEYKNTEEKTFEKRMEGLIMHMFNHEAHHRAMISVYLEMIGKENDYNNILPLI
ncbi:MAG: DinB family protein [Spirochaetales bacterium]|nr:DinB family protein [Spirochaetales bacterium]